MPRSDTVDVLGIGAHPDDVELFAGGTLLRLAALGYATGIAAGTRRGGRSSGSRAGGATPKTATAAAASALGR